MATVLALDPDEVSLFSLQEILETFGHTLIPITDPAEVLTVVRNQPFDLILVDLLTPGIEAVELVQQILKEDPTRRLVAVTAHPKAPLALKALEAGACCLMRKPFEIRLVIQMLEEPRA